MLTLADIAPEGVLLAGAGRAILLQIAYPEIGYGVARHSDFANRPMDRLNATLSYIYALSSGSDDDVRIMQRAVNRAHAGVRNPPAVPSTPGTRRTPDASPRPAVAQNAPPAAVADTLRDPDARGAASGGAAVAQRAVNGGAGDTLRDREGSAPGPRAGDPHYDARDPQLQLWVAATLYDTALTVYETVYGELDDVSAERVYREYSRLGTTLQMPEHLWPATRAEFRAYFDETLERLRVDDTVRAVAGALLRAEKAPLVIRRAMPVARLVTVALLPEAVRREFGFAWSDARQRRFARLVRVGAPIYRVLPRGIRRWPQRRYVARIRADYA
ncbi:oxygenase MpaB family protein [Herbiconiux daphne]|uniref:DUF2236 domain-containing protein n=1 Tax=Herbiconiux daphne TaxID=2970914 RepID=A0ABT2H165_9MICO|nr:oxygenase MpaB family protein [Herbiconiux daphne]MCS5733659.1 DUF2236 domain-containing protein [Herbiconiux daphne]